MSSSWYTHIESNPRSINKGTGLRQLAARLNIPMSQVMSLDNNGNIASMLTCTDYGVAMGNASADALTFSRWQTADNAQDGAAAAIWELVPEQPGKIVRRL